MNKTFTSTVAALALIAVSNVSANAGVVDKVGEKVIRKVIEKILDKSVPNEGKIGDGTMDKYIRDIERTIEVGEKAGRTG